jgi:dTDP-4-amino-4,6-dideoxygalactose transaminase
MQIQPNILDHDADLRQAMHVLESSSIKICVVVDATGKVQRTVTDGDVRRALLGGADLTAEVTDLPGQPPFVLPDSTERTTLASELKARDIDVIVLVDAADRPTGLVHRNEFFDTLLLSPPHMGLTEAGYVKQAFDDNWLAPAGPNLSAFEDGLRAVSGRAHALAVSSGTAGLHLALRVLDIGPGDRVYVADLTFVATVQPVLYEHATPVLIDAEPDSWNISPPALARALARDAALGKLPKAIIVVHLYGQSADMSAIMALSDRYGVPVIEDAAESIGAAYGNRPSGAHGLLSVYSFNGNKIITTSGGGALLSDRPDLIERAKKLSTQGREQADHYQHSEVAYNYRMSNVLAGIGRGQLEVLAERVAARRAIFARYVHGLRDLPGLSYQRELPGSVGNRWLTVLSLDPDVVPIHGYQLMRGLRARGIETRPAWKPMQMQPLLLGAEFEPHSEDAAVGPGLFLRSLCLPSGSAMTVSEQDQVIGAIRSVLLRDIAA